VLQPLSIELFFLFWRLLSSSLADRHFKNSSVPPALEQSGPLSLTLGFGPSLSPPKMCAILFLCPGQTFVSDCLNHPYMARASTLPFFRRLFLRPLSFIELCIFVMLSFNVGGEVIYRLLILGKFFLLSRITMWRFVS